VEIINFEIDFFLKSNQKPTVGIELMRRKLNLKSRNAIAKQLNKNIDEWIITIIIGAIFGNIMVLAGFYFWYFKLQRYQDRILKREAERK